MDSPWRRLPWTLPAALLIWSAALWGLACFMAQPANRPAEQVAIDARLIEVPASTETQLGVAPVPAQEPPAVVPKPKPLPHVKPRLAPVPRQAGARIDQKTDVLTKGADAPGGNEATPAVNNSAEAGSHEGRDSSQGDLFANSGARAIVQPRPQIPEDLRGGALKTSALARFHIAVDGSAEVELATPTPNPRLNRILLDTLKKWRFMPALKSGRPVASTEDILVKIEVK
ncbi:MAG: energy transducer TonB [Syntrophobacteraceae bacterium]